MAALGRKGLKIIFHAKYMYMQLDINARILIFILQEIEAKHVVYTDGCIVQLKFWINDHLRTIGALGFTFAFMQVSGLIVILT